MNAKLEADRPWALFYRDGKSLDEIVSECGGTVHDYSPWLTMPLTRAAADAAQDTHERRMKRINELEAALRECQMQAADGVAFVERDGYAYAHFVSIHRISASALAAKGPAENGCNPAKTLTEESK